MLLILAVLRSATSLKLFPFQFSVSAVAAGVGFSPPKTTASEYNPPAPLSCLAVFKLFTSVQAEPFQLSVFTVIEGPPPVYIAAV